MEAPVGRPRRELLRERPREPLHQGGRPVREDQERGLHAARTATLYEVRWGLPDRFGLGVQGTYGSVAVRDFLTHGAAEAENIGLFIQDTWNVTPNFTLNLGVRTEQERVPNYGAARDPSLPKNAIEFDFEDKLAPRLGFSWDVTGKQQLKVYGSYGTYYDITKLEMPRGSFGADRWITSALPAEHARLVDPAGRLQPGHQHLRSEPLPGPRHAEVTRDLRAPSDPADGIDPDLQPMENREFQLGLDYQLTKNSVVSARYVNKKLINTIEDIGYLVFNADGTSEEVYITGNPGKGVVAGDPAGPVPPQGEAIRDYEAIELTFNRRFADNFSFRAAYVYSSLTGNYSGLASSDEFGRTDPNVARYFDGLAYSYDSNGSFVDGALVTDRPHAFEVQGVYQAPFGTQLGLNFSWASGGAKTTNATYNGVYFYPNGREDMGRLPNITATDLSITHPFKIGDFRLELSLNVLNLFDEDTVTRVGVEKYFDDICDVRADCDGTNEWYFSTLVPYDYDHGHAGGRREPEPAVQQGHRLAGPPDAPLRREVRLLAESPKTRLPESGSAKALPLFSWWAGHGDGAGSRPRKQNGAPVSRGAVGCPGRGEPRGCPLSACRTAPLPWSP